MKGNKKRVVNGVMNRDIPLLKERVTASTMKY
jgi:hypothetical protein